MRKKIRRISVDGNQYAWAVEERLWPDFTLRVWRGKGDVWFVKEFGAPDSLKPVTPKDVADAIRAQLDGGPSSFR